MRCSPDGAVPNGMPLPMWVSEYSHIQSMQAKKPEFSLDQYYLTRNIGVLLEKTCGIMKGCVLDHLFYQEVSLQGWHRLLLTFH